MSNLIISGGLTLSGGINVAYNVGSALNESYQVAIIGSSVIIRRGANDYIGWGKNTAGNLGNGNKTDIPTPTALTYGVDFKSIVGPQQELSGYEMYQTAVALASGTDYAYGWGRNLYGEIGDGTGFYGQEWTTPKKALGDKAYSLISYGACTNFSNSGSWYVLALEKDTGVCYSWGTGDNYTGALGRYGNVGTPSIATAGTTYIKVHAGYNPFGITPFGALYTWSSPTPVLFDNSRVYTDVKTTQGGYVFSDIAGFAMDAAGIIYSWRPNISDNVGILGRTSGTATTPNPISGDRSYSKFSVGGNHAAAIEAGTNKLYVWGGNAYGQLGDGTQINKNVPTLIAANMEFSEVVCGGNFTVAIEKNTNDVYVWGRGEGNRLGTGSTSNVLVPTKITLPGPA